MTEKARVNGRRVRLYAGGAVVAVALGAAGVLGGAGFAKLPPAAPQSGKVTICHLTHSRTRPQVTITIARAAWPAHQRRGDTLGACQGTTTTTSTTTSTSTTTTTGTTTGSSQVPPAPGRSGESHGNPHGGSPGNHGHR